MKERHSSPLLEQSVQRESHAPSFSAQARALWAKSGDENGYLNLPQHLMDTAGAAGAVYDIWVAEPLKQQLAAGLGITKDQVRHLYIWLAGTHDAGKACLKFQTQLEKKGGFEHLISNLADAGLPLLVLFIGDAQRAVDRIGVFILLVDKHIAEVMLFMHVVQPQADQHAVI